MMINKQWLFSVYRNEAPADGGEGGGSSIGEPTNESASDVFSSLADETRVSLEKNGIKDIEGLAKQFTDLQSHLGNSIRVPSEHASEEDRRKFYDKLQKHAPNLIPRPSSEDPESLNAVLAALGRPDDVDGYGELQVPDGVNIGDDRLSAIKEAAHKHGLTKSQFEGMMQDVLGMDAQAAQSVQQEIADSRLSVEKEWGAVFKDREAQTIAMLESTGAPEAVVQMAKEGQIGGDTLKWMYQLASAVGGGEGINTAADTGGSDGKMTPTEAEARIGEMMNNRNHPYWDSHHPDHEKAIKEMLRLASFADPKAQTSVDSLRANGVTINA